MLLSRLKAEDSLINQCRHNIINENQTAYIKGRYIGMNARLILDIFEYCETENLEGILLFLDF